MDLIRPGAEHLPSFLDALRRGWSPDTTLVGRDQETIDRVTSDPDRFLELMDDREAVGGSVRQPDGTSVRRLPGLTRWMWDGEFAGSINLRWQPGTTDLPPTCLGHIGYAVVPWKRGRGYATAALAAMLPIAAAEGLAFVEISTDLDNMASRRVIGANGGVLLTEYAKPDAAGGGPAVLYRVDLAPHRPGHDGSAWPPSGGTAAAGHASSDGGQAP
jgi:predicted acetyltransferase